MTHGQAAVVKDTTVVDRRREALTELNALTPRAVEVLRDTLNSGVPELEIAAARVVLERVGLPATAYSFKGHISNRTNVTLALDSKDTNGSWGTEPPATIAPGASPMFYADYDGFDFTGKVIYKAEGGTFEVTWNIPLFGDNKITVTTSIPGTKARYEGGRGWHAEVWYYLEAV